MSTAGAGRSRTSARRDGDARAPAAQGEGGQLLADGKDLKHEVGAVAAGGDEGAEEQPDDLQHGRMRIVGGVGNVNDRRDGLWRGVGRIINDNLSTYGDDRCVAHCPVMTRSSRETEMRVPRVAIFSAGSACYELEDVVGNQELPGSA